MKNLLMILMLFKISGCIEYEWEVSPRRIFRPSPIFCYKVYNETTRCFPSAETCINDERLHDSISTTPCRTIYLAR